jgi:predicted Zn finger-like uncharacterized protein
MIVQCDKCGAKFQLADDKITDKGTKVRCSKCKAIFTVSKAAETAPAPAPAAAAVPAPPRPTPPAAGGAPRKEEDPFSDFNFSDDLDFGEQENTAKTGPKPEPPQSFLDSVPSAPIPAEPKTPTAQPPDDDGGFDFSDEEFSLSAPEPPKAAPPPKPAPAPAKPAAKTAPPKPAAPAPAKPGGAATDEFGDFKFDDDSFSGAPGSAAPPGELGGGGADEWGNVSLGEEQPPAAPAAKGKAEFEDEVDGGGFGDFKFDADDKLPAAGKDDEIDMNEGFVRSPTSKAPVRDSLEANIGEGDGEPEPPPKPAARRPEPAEATPSPPKPTIKMAPRPSRGKGWIVIVVILVLLLGGLGGAVAFTNGKGWFTFSDLIHFRYQKIGQMPPVNNFLILHGYRTPPDTGTVEIVADSVKADQVTRDDLGTLIVVEGSVVNRTRKVQSRIRVEAALKNEAGDVIVKGSSYCGTYFTADELKTMDKEDFKSIMDTASGRDLKCMEVRPGESRSFAIVFFDLPPGGAIKVAPPQVAEFQPLGE